MLRRLLAKSTDLWASTHVSVSESLTCLTRHTPSLSLSQALLVSSQPRLSLHFSSLPSSSTSTSSSTDDGAPDESLVPESASRPPRRVRRSFTNAPRPLQPVERLPDGSQPPWTPTNQLVKRKAYPKRMGHMLNVLNSEYEDKVAEAKPNFPDFKPGDILHVDLVVPENNMRPSFFRGICMAIYNKGPLTRFTMRNVMKGTGIIERDFRLYSPFLKGIRVESHRRVRRAKLTYLRKQRLAANTF